MSNLEVLDVMYQTFQLALKLALPFLVVSMVVGVLIAIFQAATQINEQTLTFVPKIICVFVALILFGPWMMNSMVGFMAELWSSFSFYVHQ